MSTLAVSQNEKNIPRPIVDKLRSVVRRARNVILVRGLLIVCAVALIALLLGMAIDSSILIFSSTIRLAISLTLLGSVFVAAWLFLVRPLSRSFDLTGIARIIEQRHPELEERISSAVELLTSNDASEIRDRQPEHERHFCAPLNGSERWLCLSGSGLCMLQHDSVRRQVDQLHPATFRGCRHRFRSWFVYHRSPG